MKKNTLFTLIVAILLIIIGGISSLFLGFRLNQDYENHVVKENYPYDNSKTLIITLQTNAFVQLRMSSTDSTQLSYHGNSLDTSQVDTLDWQTEKKNEQTTLNITTKEPKQINKFNFFPFDSAYSNNGHLTLEIAPNYEKVIINGRSQYLELTTLDFKELVVKNQQSYVSMHDSHLDDLTIENNQGAALGKVIVKNNLNISAKNGEISLTDAKAKSFTLNNVNNDIFTANTSGDLVAKTINGQISVNHNSGVIDLTTKTGDIFLHTDLDKKHNPITAISDHGDLDFEFSEKQFLEDSVLITSDIGEITELFNKNLTSRTRYEKGKGKPVISAHSTSGDISVQAIGEDDDHYGDDFN